eukprot:TRINITY_DN27784_c0_g1_i1.p1 TRINITY_DN27784_c0_g1~~TRINITY_DN27784_c0_g1_i1.p1  ORF type:complete len:556 (+),score=67.69 TRINITY_DN27784_c0_g1_i1:150-1817(+)
MPREAVLGDEWRGTLPPVEEWQQNPLMLRWSPLSKYNPLEEVPINARRTIPFETELFKGHFHLAIRYCPESEVDPWEKGSWCYGKQRKIVVYVSGEFKKRLSFDEVLFGFEWGGPLSPPKGIGLAMQVCEHFSPGLDADVTCEKPYMFNTLAGGADYVHVWKPGDNPADKLDPNRAYTLHERNAGDLPKFKHMRDRARWMSKKHPNGGTNAQNSYFEPGWTYSFELYTHLLFMHLFEVHFPIWPTFWKVSLDEYFNGQPYPVLARTKSGEVLWNLEVWHEKTARRSPADVWRQGPRVTPKPKEPEKEKEKEAEKPFIGPPVPEKPDLQSPKSIHGEDEKSDISFRSCEDLFDEDGLPRGIEDPDEGGPSGDSCDDAPLSPPPTDLGLQEGVSPAQGPLLLPTPSRRDEIGTVLYKGKRLRTAPSDHASWASKRKEIPQGCQVRVLSVKPGWTEVELQVADKKTGWIKSRNLSKGTSTLRGPEPRRGVIKAKKKRVRATPAKKARRHGPYLEDDSVVDVLTQTDCWVLIVPNSSQAGWIKADHISIQPETPDGGGD